jgi:hypothetical protein
MADALAERVVYERSHRGQVASVDAGPICQRLDRGDGDIEIPRIRWQHQANLIGHALTLAHDVGRCLVIP